MESQLQLEQEINDWCKYLHDLIGFNIYLKGGSVLGLKILQMMINHGKLNDQTLKDFCELQLIKDWDYTIYYDENIILTKEIYEKHNIKNEASTMIVVRHTNKTMINGESLFEASIKKNEPLSALEIPLTSMKIKLKSLEDIQSIKKIAAMFYNNNIDLDQLISIINRIKIEIMDCENGLFNITNDIDNIDNGDLSLLMLNLISESSINSSQKQFLISNLVQPDRLFYRFKEKNIKKNAKIVKFLTEMNISIKEEKWLIDDTNKITLEKLIDDFIISVQEHINNLIKRDACGFVDIYTLYNEYQKYIIKLDNYYDINNNQTQSIINKELLETKPNKHKCENLQIKIEKMRSNMFNSIDEIKNSFGYLDYNILDKFDSNIHKSMKKIYDADINPKTIKELKAVLLKIKSITKTQFMLQIVAPLDALFMSVNIGRLAGMYSDNTKINDSAREQIKLMFKPIMDIPDFASFVSCLSISDNNILSILYILCKH